MKTNFKHVVGVIRPPKRAILAGNFQLIIYATTPNYLEVLLHVRD